MRDLWNKAAVPFICILFFFICLFLFTKLFGPIPFYVNSIQTTKSDLFTVTGEGKATAAPDTALLTLGVTKNASTVSDAQNQANTVINSITADLKNLGVEEKNIKTTTYTISPNYDYTNGQSINGYTVTADLEVKVTPVAKANQAIDLATKDGANVTNGATFILDDQAQQKLEDQARTDAVQKAKQKAESLAKAAGIHLGTIVDVQENNTGPMPQQLPMADLQVNQKQSAPTQLNPGENSVDITVTLSYQTY